MDGGDLYVVDQLGNVTRLDLADGARRWTTDTKALTTHAHPIRVNDAILVWNERARSSPSTGTPARSGPGAGRPGSRSGWPPPTAWSWSLQRLVTDDAFQAFRRRSHRPARPGAAGDLSATVPGNPSIPLGISHARHPKVATGHVPAVQLGRKVNNPREGNSAWLSSP